MWLIWVTPYEPSTRLYIRWFKSLNLVYQPFTVYYSLSTELGLKWPVGCDNSMKQQRQRRRANWGCEWWECGAEEGSADENIWRLSDGDSRKLSARLHEISDRRGENYISGLNMREEERSCSLTFFQSLVAPTGMCRCGVADKGAWLCKMYLTRVSQ